MKQQLLKDIRAHKHCYIWIAPFFILFFLVSVYPAFYGVKISLTKYNGLGAPKWVGLKNYANLLHDPLFFQTLANTFILWALIVPLRTLLALIFATFLNSSKLIGRKIYSQIVLLPYITAVAIVAIVFRMLLTTEGGFLNFILTGLFGIEPIGWLDTTEYSKISIALMNLWRMTGYFSLVMLAGMQKIPRAVEEAAMLDGVGPIGKFIRITIPLMIPEIFFITLISTIWIFQNVGDVMLLTGGGPINSSTTLIYYVYQNGYEYSKMGYASALSNVLFVILLGISSFVVRNYYGKTGK